MSVAINIYKYIAKNICNLTTSKNLTPPPSMGEDTGGGGPKDLSPSPQSPPTKGGEIFRKIDFISVRDKFSDLIV